MRNKTLTRIIIATLLCAFLTFTVGKVTRVSALAVGPLADPVYDTEIYAFKDYVEQNLTNPQLDIMFFLIGGLAVAQMGAQDAMLISPYPNEENVKEWIINCGIQLYNSVIGLVPEGDYYMGIPSIGTSGTKGVPREVIKGLVAQMMGDAVVAINYPDLDTFLEENPDQILLPFNRDLQLGVNAVFGLNGGALDWQISQRDWSDGSFVWKPPTITGTLRTEYDAKLAALPLNRVLANFKQSNINGAVYAYFLPLKYDLFINTNAHTVKFYNSPNELTVNRVYIANDSAVGNNDDIITFFTETYDPTQFNNYQAIARYYLNYIPSSGRPFLVSGGYYNYSVYFANFDFVKRVMVGPSWDSATEIFNTSDLNLESINQQYYQQVTSDYLFDLRGLMGDLVNYVYLNPIWDNIYDLVGNLVLPDRINVSIDLTPITDLLAPPIPVNMNDFALYTENDYLEEIRDRSEKFGETIGEYFVFWHNADTVTVYVIFGSVIVILLGAFVGKLGHS